MNISQTIDDDLEITYKNYEAGIIKGHQLAFQSEQWYYQNKDNFSNSLKENFPELLPPIFRNTEQPLPNNYLGFYPDEFIRFGFLERLSITDRNFWVVRIPAGLQLYHSSRSLGLNHSDFPIPGYDDTKSLKENEDTIFGQCTDLMGYTSEDVENVKICSYISYYSTPYVTANYLTSESSYAINQIKYAYGINGPSDNNLFNDRVRMQSDEYRYGVQAYELMEDTYFVILALDDYLIDRPDLGRENMRAFRDIMIQMAETIRMEMNINQEGWNNFIDLIPSVTGIGSLADNVRHVPNIEKTIRDWLARNANPPFLAETAGYIRNTTRGVKQGITDFNRYKGLRYSIFGQDRIVMNMLGWLFQKYEPKVAGFISSSLFVAGKGRSVIKNEPFIRGEFNYYIPDGMFHSEVGMFFAPAQLKRNKFNKYDINYSIDYLGITEEMRKYKTDNILNQTGTGFHQGHLFEHSMWVALNSEQISDQRMFRQIPKDIYLIAGYLHDIGKSGDCTKTSVYKGFDPHDPQSSICNFIYSNNDLLGMRYYDLPDHPEKGYEYLKGYRTYKQFTLTDETKDIYLQDWEQMFDRLEVSEFHRKIIRIAVATHWYYGDTIRKSGGIADFVRKIEMFYNDEFINQDIKTFFRVITFVVAISLADILGSQYNPDLKLTGLSQDEKATFINFLPNVHQEDYANYDDPTPIIEQLVSYVQSIQNKQVLENVKTAVKPFLDSVWSFLNTNFAFRLNNCYSIFFNLTNTYVSIADIKRAYSNKFPSIIVFDIDQTLLNVRFSPNEMSTYYIYPDTYRVIEEAQKVRKMHFPDDPTYVILISRHYAPKSLLKLIQSEYYGELNKKNPMFYENFDMIISQYTGPAELIQRDVSHIPGFFQYNGTPADGFVVDNNSDETQIYPTGIYDLNISKYEHFRIVKERYDVEYAEILAFDDDPRYFSEVGMGAARDVRVAGVLRSSSLDSQGIRMPLFRQGISRYVFDNF